MTAAHPPINATLEQNAALRRARAFVLVRVALDLLLLSLALLERRQAGWFSPAIPLAVDLAGLFIYWLAVRRWPVISTYIQIMLGALVVIALDFSLGRITFFPWMLLIPLGLAGGLIVPRPGFNSLVSLSLVGLFTLYLTLIVLGSVPLPLDLDGGLLAQLAAAVGVVLITLNALVESLVVHLFNWQQNLNQVQVQLFYTRAELERSQYERFDSEREVRRTARYNTISQITRQLSRSLQEPVSAMEMALAQPDETLSQPEWLEGVRRQVGVARRMIDSLEAFADLGASRMQTVNLDDLVATEVGHMRIPNHITLQVHQPPVFPPIQADASQMRLLIFHLLDNAVNAIGAKPGRIDVRLAPAPEGVRLSVSDTGPGIAPDQLEIIFEPLYTTRAQGFGLGLAICRQIVDMHGGGLRVESAPGQGATFVAYLPRVARHLPEDLAADMAG